MSRFSHRVLGLLLIAACDRAPSIELAATPSAAADPSPPSANTAIPPTATPSTSPAAAPRSAVLVPSTAIPATIRDEEAARTEGRSTAIVTVSRRFGPKQGIACGFVHFVRAFEVVLESHTSGPELPEKFVLVVSCVGGGIDKGDRLEVEVGTKRSRSQPDPASNETIPKSLPRRYGTLRRA